MGTWRWTLLIGAATIIGLLIWARDRARPYDVASLALARSGHKEFVMTFARASHCPKGEATIAYASQNPPAGSATTGYICTRRSGETTFIEGSLDPNLLDAH